MQYPDVQIIVVKLNLSFPFERYMHWLNADSRRKVCEYRFRIDQMRSFISELLKYYYLAKVLSVPLDKINISSTDLGKPILTGELQYVSFSISHSGDYIVMAFSTRYKVGVDIEQIDKHIEPLQLGKLVFSASENGLINQNINYFFMLWSKKEALFKARGTGFINDYYTKTSLTLELNEAGDGYKISSQLFADDYYLSLCVLLDK